MGTVRNDISKHGTRIRIVNNSRVEVTLVFNVGKTRMEVWWHRQLPIALRDTAFFLSFFSFFLFFLLNCCGCLWNVLFISAWMHSAVSGLLSCFTSLLGRTCQLLWRNNKRSHTVSRKCWHSQRNRYCISCNEFRPTDGRINEICPWHSSKPEEANKEHGLDTSEAQQAPRPLEVSAGLLKHLSRKEGADRGEEKEKEKKKDRRVGGGKRTKRRKGGREVGKRNERGEYRQMTEIPIFSHSKLN